MVERNKEKSLGAPQGPFHWRAVTATPELEAEGFLGLEELVVDDLVEKKSKTKKRKREKEKTQTNEGTQASLTDAATKSMAAKTTRNKQQRGQQHQQQQQQQQHQDAAADGASASKKQKRKRQAAAAAASATEATAPTAVEKSRSNSKNTAKPLPGIGGPTAAEAAAAAPTAGAAAAAAFECMYDSYEMVDELDKGLALWKPHLDNDICILHPAVSRVLLQLQLRSPTPVQQEVLLHAARDRKDVVAAAQTGSGKTLAFAVPVVSSLASQLARRLEKWQERLNKQKEEEQESNRQEKEDADDEASKQQFLLQQLHPQGPAALVLEPTRELALQVLHVVQQLCTYTPIRAAAVVGGLSPEKQLRVLGSSKPLILVATPGRLLALQREQPPAAATTTGATITAATVTAEEDMEELRQQQQQQQSALQQKGRKERLAHEGLLFCTNFSLLQFLVLDEADRLLLQQQQQQHRHLKKKRKQEKKKTQRIANPPTETEILLQLVYAQLDCAPAKGSSLSNNRDINNINNNKNNSKKKKQQKQQQIAGKLRGRAASLQTFVLSATLALALQRKQQGLQLLNSNNSNGSGSSRKEDEEETVTAAALLQHVRIRPKAMVAVRISDEQQQAYVWQQPHQQQQEEEAKQQEEQQEETEEGLVALRRPDSKLPATLRLSVWKSPIETEMEIHLAAYLLRTFELSCQQKKTLKVVLFVNTISYVYRLESLLALLLRIQMQQRHHEDIAVCGLHSNLQQKQRLKRLDRFLKSRYGLLVSTDVAARGVDFKNICKILNFKKPRDVETFIHRCGRTARAGRAGEAICFISSETARQWEVLLAAAGTELGWAPPPLGFNDVAAFLENSETMKRLFHLAAEIEYKTHSETKRKRAMGTMRKMAAAADVEFESDISGSEGEEEINTKMRMKNESAIKKLRQILATYVP